MVDPTDALVSFQDAYTRGFLSLQKGAIHDHAFMFDDEPVLGKKRFTYVLIESGEVVAFANLSPTDSLGGIFVFQIGYAVPFAHRNKGLARQIAQIAIDEMDHSLRRASIPEFYIEASVMDSNPASQRVAQSVFGESAQSGVDPHTGHTLKLYRVLLGQGAVDTKTQ